MDFICIDFETANEKRASVCAVALIFFKDGKIVDVKEWLLKPPKAYNYFSDFNIQIHNITPEMVKNKPEFNEIWPEVKPLLDNKLLVAHNAPFDMSVLRNLIDYYNLDYPEFNFICTCNVSRKTWDKQINYTLKNIANNLGYIFNHHDAHDDAKTCGKILLEAFKFHNVSTIEELANKIDMRIGYFSENNYLSCSIQNGYKGLSKSDRYIKINEIATTATDFDEEHPFYQKKVIFTGTLKSMTRRNAMQRVVDVGGIIGKSVTSDTNYLIMGMQDCSKFVDGKESSKTKKAKKYIKEGQNLKIITEDTFVKILSTGECYG